METKYCRWCDSDKPVEDFHFKNTKNNTRADLCKVCCSEYTFGRRVERGRKKICIWCGINCAQYPSKRCSTCLQKKNEVRNDRAFQKKCRIKIKAIEYLGGKCLDCGLISKYLCVYDV